MMLPSASTQRSYGGGGAARFLIRVETATMDKGVDGNFFASKGFNVSDYEWQAPLKEFW